ncbi:unnamed protein product [Polarella glacialis]|uniref:Ubiquitin-like domain-containing protein n=1 Tax=Polarella glacialis TaxID=89957 RepID=A0A813FR42_POLGL|nr:unnamed protein product [Polarella glacialis]
MMMVEVYHMSGRKTEVNVKPSDTARHVKEQIEAQEGISADWINLFFQGQQLLDGQPLSDYQIEASSIVTMACSPIWRIFWRFIKPEHLPLDVRPSDLVRDVKAIIAAASGQDASRLRLILKMKAQNKHLVDDDSELIDCGVENGSSIGVVFIKYSAFQHPIDLFVIGMSNLGPRKLQAAPPYALRDIYIELRRNGRFQQLVLSYEGQILEEGRTLEDYGMQKNKDYTVHLVPRP